MPSSLTTGEGFSPPTVSARVVKYDGEYSPGKIPVEIVLIRPHVLPRFLHPGDPGWDAALTRELTEAPEPEE